MKILIMLLMFISVSANAAYCSQKTGNHGTLNGRPISEFYTDGLPSMEQCADFVILTAVEYTVINEKAKQVDQVEEITAVSVMTAFMFGFGTYATFWFLGLKGRLAKQAIKFV